MRPESLPTRTRCPRAEGACPADSSAARMAQALAVSAAQSPELPTRRRGDNGFIMRREVAAEAEAGHGQAELDRESSQAHERDVRASLKRKTAHTCLSLNRSVGRTFGGRIESRKEDTRVNIPICGRGLSDSIGWGLTESRSTSGRNAGNTAGKRKLE